MDWTQLTTKRYQLCLVVLTSLAASFKAPCANAETLPNGNFVQPLPQNNVFRLITIHTSWAQVMVSN